MAWTATVLTLFPELFPGPLAASVAGTALDEGRWALETVDIRDYGLGNHASVDDTPAGGGPGMVMRADVIAPAVDAARAAAPHAPVICLSPRGAPLTQARVRTLSEGPGATLLCGRFEGIDERVLAAREIEEVSLGDFILSGGEVAAMALIEACVRLLPGVVGEAASLECESFEQGLLECPHYTRPREWEGRAIPEVLLSGDHGRVEAWRREISEKITKERRPDLWERFTRGRGARGPER